MSIKHIIDSQYSQLYASCSKTPTPEQALAARRLRRMGSAWECLHSCSQMDEIDRAQSPWRALADAAMAMIDEPKTREGVLGELASIALRLDSPTLWGFARGHGFDPALNNKSHLLQWFSHRIDAEPSAWMCKAIHLRAWACVEMLAACPDGRIGLPSAQPAAVAEPALAALGSKPRKSRALSAADDDYLRMAQLDATADWWTLSHPALFEWRRESLGEEPIPTAAKKALAAHGFGSCFGVEGFDRAAARLALDGSGKALRACVGAKIDPAIALPPPLGSKLDTFSRQASPPRLALSGGLEAQPAAAKTWAKATEWIDRAMGPGSSDAMVHDAAILVLSQWSPLGQSWDRHEAPVGKALAWLAARGPARPAQAAAELTIFQNLSIELAEITPSKTKPKAPSELEKIALLMDQWSASIHGPAKPRRILKA